MLESQRMLAQLRAVDDRRYMISHHNARPMTRASVVRAYRRSQFVAGSFAALAARCVAFPEGD